MNRRLLWKLCLIIATGTVALFYFIDQAVTHTEEDMSMLTQADRETIRAWGKKAETFYEQGELEALNQWLAELEQAENTWVSVASANIQHIAGSSLEGQYVYGYNLGRDVEWKVHLYFEHNPVMEVPFSSGKASFLIQLPESMRPGVYWEQTRIVLQIILPMILLGILSLVLYQHIMSPLRQLELATRQFSQGNLDVRVRQLLGNRDDELSQLSSTFDRMAARIGELIISQRQLIADLSHELRTPLARLDIAVEALFKDPHRNENLERIRRESRHIRKLVDDTLTLAWLDTEQPQLKSESLDLVDLIDVLIEDARFEFPNRTLSSNLPDSAPVENSSHLALGQALENILRNAMRYTPAGKKVTVDLHSNKDKYQVTIQDEGPGVPDQHLKSIFKPFFRVDASRMANSESFGLGLALSQRQIEAIGGKVWAKNRHSGGLEMQVDVPKSAQT